MKRDSSMNQYFTPQWAAERIVDHYYSHLTHDDVVYDAGCGDGRFLRAIPSHVKAYGIELDEVLARETVATTEREIIIGDFTEVEFPEKPTLILGNPPYSLAAVRALLDRAHELMDYDREVGLMIPVYFFQTAGTVMDLARKWSIRHDLLPRNMFYGLEKPIMFARFIKERQAVLSGMFLYEETCDALSLKRRYRTLFVGNESSSNLWGEAVEKALIALGGEASLQDIYREIEGVRPTSTTYWKEQIRKVCQEAFCRVGRGVYALLPSASRGANGPQVLEGQISLL